jgi:hypothetical protein
MGWIMIIACMFCGGVIETMLLVAGLGVIYRWFKKRHKKDNCKCCQDHHKKEKHE